MIAVAVAATVDEDDAVVAGRSVEPPLRAYSVGVVAAAERLRQRRPWMRNAVGKSDDDVEDQGPSHPRRVDFLIAQSYELSSL